MKKFIKRFLKRSYVKWVLFNRKMNNPDYNKVSETQKKCMSIARLLILHPDSSFRLSFLSKKRYIKNKTLGLFLILDGKLLSITNHVHHHDIVISDMNYDRFTKMYDEKVEEIRKKDEDEVMSQIVHGLDIILDKIKNKMG
jgi:hypothetical protein